MYGSFSDEDCMKDIDQSSQFYVRAFRSFENDISIESILRSQRKLESAVSSLMMNNDDLIRKAKLIYYSNVINYSNLDDKVKKRFLHENKCLEFLQSTTANRIEIKKENGEMCLEVEEENWNVLREDKSEKTIF